MPQDQSFGCPLLWYCQQKQSECVAIWRSIILGAAFRDFAHVNILLQLQADRLAKLKTAHNRFVAQENIFSIGPAMPQGTVKVTAPRPQPENAPQARYRRSNSPPTTPVPPHPLAGAHTAHHAKPPLKNFVRKTIPSTDYFQCRNATTLWDAI